MGLFRKPTVQIDHDEEIRREIRVRVAKQVGIYDEEYIQTGKIGGTPVVEQPTDSSGPTTIPSDTQDAIPSDSEDAIPVAPITKKSSKAKKAQKKKNINIVLILIFLFLIIAFIPLYYYLTGVGTL